MNDRDTFAAAALSGLLAASDANSWADDLWADDICRTSYGWADAMLRERQRTNHDAAPAARATADRYVPRAAADGDSDRTDKAEPRPSDGTGDTPVTEPMPVFVSGSGFVTPVAYAGNNAEPVAFGVMRVGGRWVSILGSAVQAETSRASFDKTENWVHEIVPLYRQPPCQDFSQKNLTLTNAEREFLQALHNAYEESANQTGYVNAAAQADSRKNAAIIRGLLERMK